MWQFGTLMVNESPFDGLPLGQARVILCDPPWLFKSYSEKDISKMPQAHYACMSIDDIAALPVKSLADPKGCTLIMWATSPMLDQQMAVLKAWGFTYKTQGQWVKLTKYGKLAFSTGHIYRSASEPWLVGTIGHPKQLVKNVRNVIMAQVREHSRKPDQMRKNIERQWAGPYVELFGRQAVPGWTVWGNQVDRFPARGAAAGARYVQPDLLEAA
jgi:N6-adenosine-specific RNA methylase IME4